VERQGFEIRRKGGSGAVPRKKQGGRKKNRGPDGPIGDQRQVLGKTNEEGVPEKKNWGPGESQRKETLSLPNMLKDRPP